MRKKLRGFFIHTYRHSKKIGRVLQSELLDNDAYITVGERYIIHKKLMKWPIRLGFFGR